MLVDLRDARGLPEASDWDLCIVGAGAAGIALATRLLDRRRRVLLLEAGGLALDAGVTDAYRGEVVGLPYHALTATRLRFLGGSTNHWGGKCAPLRPFDLRERSWVPGTGWPFGWDELEPHYRGAQEILDLGDLGDYDPGFPERSGRAPSLLPARDFYSRTFQISSPTRMGEKYRGVLEQARDLAVWLHAPVSELSLETGGRRVEHVSVARPGAPALRVRARAFVLAAGGIEIPRLLLNSDRVAPRGIGNDHDLVGRYFMDHPSFAYGRLLPSRPEDWIAAYDQFAWRGVLREPRVAFGDALLEREGMLSTSVQLRAGPPAGKETEGYRALLGVRDALLGRDEDADLEESLSRLLDDLAGAGQGLYDSAFGGPSFRLYVRTEQAPNRDSRITLGEERDATGLRRVRLDWRLGELDVASARRAAEILAREVGRLGLGRVQVADWLVEEPFAWDEDLIGNHHHMGTTRMHADPRQGVVDADCRVHGVENLYVASCSVFPGGGYCNPTLTIVALSLRLAGHLAKRLG